MRFGIMAMQMNELIPRGNSLEEMMSNVAGFSHAGLIRRLAEQGFNLIELGGDLSLFLPHTFAASSIEEVEKAKQAHDLSYTVHLPLWSVEPSTPLTPVRKGSADAIIEIIHATRAIQPEIYVLHATGALAAEFYRMRIPETARSLLLSQFQNGARDSIRRILSETGIPSRRLAIETIEFPLEQTLQLAEEFDLSICFDTGHVLAGFSGDVDFFDALEACLPRLGEIHLHDAHSYALTRKLGYGDDHQALGKGDLDLKQLLQRLQEARFMGPIIFELMLEEALASLEEIHAQCPEALEK